MFASLLPQLCLSRLQMVSKHKRGKHSWCSSLQPLHPLLLRYRLQEEHSWMSPRQTMLLYELRHNVNTDFISVAKRGLELGHLYMNVVLITSCNLVPPTVYLHTLLGCTALLRFSIHLSLSADERQEKHLVPVEVVTYRRDTEIRKMNTLIIKAHA